MPCLSPGPASSPRPTSCPIRAPSSSPGWQAHAPPGSPSAPDGASTASSSRLFSSKASTISGEGRLPTGDLSRQRLRGSSRSRLTSCPPSASPLAPSLKELSAQLTEDVPPDAPASHSLHGSPRHPHEGNVAKTLASCSREQTKNRGVTTPHGSHDLNTRFLVMYIIRLPCFFVKNFDILKSLRYTAERRCFRMTLLGSYFVSVLAGLTCHLACKWCHLACKWLDRHVFRD